MMLLLIYIYVIIMYYYAFNFFISSSSSNNVLGCYWKHLSVHMGNLHQLRLCATSSACAEGGKGSRNRTASQLIDHAAD